MDRGRFRPGLGLSVNPHQAMGLFPALDLPMLGSLFHSSQSTRMFSYFSMEKKSQLFHLALVAPP